MSASDPIIIALATPESVRPLRQLVLRPGQPPESCVYAGDDAPDTVHFTASRAREVVGVASLYKVPSPRVPEADAWQLRGMATHPNVRGIGVGARLLEACAAQARNGNAQLLWCNARSSAAGFYRKCRFESIGEEFILPSIGPHLYMHLPLNATTTA